MAQLFHATRSSDPMADPSAESDRQAYNAAFEELGLNWHWDEETFSALPSRGRDGVRAYLQDAQPHLLRAYDADFLIDVIEATKARYHAAAISHNRSHDTPYFRGAGGSPARTTT